MICIVNGRYEVTDKKLREIMAQKWPGETLEAALERDAWAPPSSVSKAAPSPESPTPSVTEEPGLEPAAKNARAKKVRPRTEWTPLAEAPKRSIVARYCRRCGEALYGKLQFCDRCRVFRNRETGRRRWRKWNSRQLTKNRVPTP